MKLTKNFSLSEFRSKDGSPFTPEVIHHLQVLADNLQVLRDHFGKEITINSGYRSEAHNNKVGGAKNSFHMKGMAADIVVKDVAPYVVYKQIELLIKYGKMKPGGLGVYDTWVHYDTRGKLYLYDKRKNKK